MLETNPVTLRPNTKSTASSELLRFDPQCRAADEALKATIKSFAAFLEAREWELGLRLRRRRVKDRSKFHLALEAIVCNLLIAAMVKPNMPVSVPRGHSVMWGKGRFASPVYGEHFVRLIDLMAHPKVALLQKTKGWRLSAKRKKPSTIRAASRLEKHLPVGKITWQHLCRDQDPEVILLKVAKSDGGGAATISYRDTAKTRKWRRQVQKINVRLLCAPISVESDTDTLLHFDKNGFVVDPNRRTLCRYFNNGRWNHGGRLFGGFWMNMKREDRFRLLRIGGERVANVDYGQLFPRLAYVRAGAPQPLGDMYDISGDGTSRDGWKKLFNALLFAERSLKHWPNETRPLFPANMKLPAMLEKIREKHAPIDHLFERGIGFALMFIESEMLIAALDGLHGLGIDALPLHDSVLVARSHAAAAREVLGAAFECHTGSGCAIVSIELGPEN